MDTRDVVLKAALFAVVARGYRLVAAVGDEFVVEVDTDCADDAIANIQQIVARAVDKKELLGPLARNCCQCAVTSAW